MINRFAGSLPSELLDLIASSYNPSDPSTWPSINNPVKSPANIRWDEKMGKDGMFAPNSPARMRTGFNLRGV